MENGVLREVWAGDGSHIYMVRLTRLISLFFRPKTRIGPLILGKMSKLAGCRRLSIVVSAVKTRVGKKNLNSFRFSIRILVDSDETFGTV